MCICAILYYALLYCFFPECVEKGSRLTLGSGGRALFATRCRSVRNRPQQSDKALPLGEGLGGGLDGNVTRQIRVK